MRVGRKRSAVSYQRSAFSFLQGWFLVGSARADSTMPVMRHILWTCLAAILGLAACGEDAGAAEIQFQPQAVVSSPVITLRDVARVLDPDPATVERLGRTVLRPAPAPGGQVRL